MSNTKVTSSFTNSKNVVKPMNSKIQPIAPAPTKPVSITKESETNNTSQSKENPAVKLPIPLSTNPSVPSNSTVETKAMIKQSPQLKQVTVLKQSSNMKQVIINKHSPKSTLVKSMTNKPTITDKSPGIRHGSPVENSSPTIRPILPKIIENSRIINTNSPTSMKPNCTSDPIVPISAANTDPLINKSTDKCIEGNPIKPNVVKYKDGSKILLQKSSTNPALSNSSLVSILFYFHCH
ncbi:unnamed protein product [Rotaria socialis]|uniref:Uncharacterized protein n=1 Tax=Rotaria socialis TaxID=392032 RepID=A0A818KRW9_9BILA|nr:unnamed protein product [Rotaria socialis]CAF4892699.1 unnamed protein product [Rotaria socialis]